MDAFTVGVGLACLGTAAGAAGLLTRRTALTTAALLGLVVLTGVGLLVAERQGLDTLALTLGTASASLFGGAALAVFPQPRWRHPVDFVALVTICGCGALATLAASRAQPGIIGVLTLTQGCVIIAYTWWRLETGDRETRIALSWTTLAATTSLLLYFFALFSSENAAGTALPMAGIAMFGVIGPAMWVGATRPELVDVRALVVRAVVGGSAMITVLAVFVMAVGLAQLLGAGDLNLGAQGILAALAATTYHPVRLALRGVVDQLLFGERPDPLGAASSVAGQFGDDPVVALRAIREALVVPYAAVLVDAEPVVASGVETTHTWSRDLGGVGTLVLGLRPGDLSFTPGDEQVLGLVVPLLAQTLRARALTKQVLESRGQTIAAVEEERRRLRRDLHDGLGPRLSGVAFTSDAARNLVRSDPAAAEGLLTQLRADTVTAIQEIRELVYAMRPPALDELGLVPALRQQAAGLRHSDGRPFRVSITAPRAPLELPAAVEVAAYRIVVEAITNVARHSTSATARVCLEAESAGLRVEVVDAGVGPDWRPGVGLSSMRERAAELGGTLEAGPGPTGGRVSALLPL